MKRVFVSQRVDVHPNYGERRDALDQKWAELLWMIGCICVPVPNHRLTISELLTQSPPDGILLSGGNNPEIYGGDTPERDVSDDLLISYAESKSIPLLGVCRGMQSIVMHFGAALRKVDGHVATRHKLDCGREVNSYHAYAPEKLLDTFLPLACSADGVLEQFKHKTLPIMGIMWHPERETPFEKSDLEMIKDVFL